MIMLLLCLFSCAFALDRVHYVRAVEEPWSYAPTHPDNPHQDRPFNEDEEVFVGDFIGAEYLKCRYVEYTDDTFTTLAPKPPHTGLLGPIFRAEVGDILHVVFWNSCTNAYSLHPHGVTYTKENEGAPYLDGSSYDGDYVQPGEIYTYTWQVRNAAAPPDSMSSRVWLYHSHSNAVEDENTGMVGMFVICHTGQMGADGLPKDVDNEIFALFEIFDENMSWKLDTMLEYAGLTITEDEESAFEESNLMHSINGFLYDSWETPVIKEGEVTRWYFGSLGTEVDLHTGSTHGNTMMDSTGSRRDVVEIMPASMNTLDMLPGNVGKWMLRCRVNDHFSAGMMMTYEVQECNTCTKTSLPVEDYFNGLHETQVAPTEDDDGEDYFNWLLVITILTVLIWFGLAFNIYKFHTLQQKVTSGGRYQNMKAMVQVNDGEDVINVARSDNLSRT